MYVNLKVEIEIDTEKYPHLKQKEIREIAMETALQGSIMDHMKEAVYLELEERNFMKEFE